MKCLLPILVAVAVAVVTAHAASDYPVKPVPFTDVRITGGVLQSRQATNSLVTLPFALGQCESSKRMTNFDLAAETMRRRAAGETNFQNKPPTQYPFDDSDVFKAIEGAAFCLSVQPDAKTAAQVEAMIKRIAAAQEPDGYLYTWRTMHPDSPAHDWIAKERWLKDPQISHELYNLGHLYEAGVAHYQATGSRSLLDVCQKSAELLQKDFGDGEPRIAPGHEVIEMGLAKLYRQTGDPRWLALAKFFLDCRGTGSEYSQNHKPVIQQTEAVGHAVRANYLYSGMADVAALSGDQRYLEAITQIWENVVGKKLHLTGGCGALAAGEAYGKDYELPHRCYNETCAAVAFLFWNHRMFLMTGDAKYMDVFERSLYNGVLSGVSLSGDRFFYPNPLEYDGKAVNNHGHAGRAPWFGCACCPPNVLRTLASLGGYVCAVQGEKLFVNLYAQGEATATVAGNKVKIEQTTSYPWSGTVTLRVKPERPGNFSLCLRIPGWVQGRPLPGDLYSYDDATPAKWSVRVNGGSVSVEPKQGFAVLTREWKTGDTVELNLPMPVRRVAGNSKIAATRGQVALERGPVVYAFEGVDNDGAVFDIVLPASAKAAPEHAYSLLGGVTVLKVAGAARAFRSEAKTPVTKPASLLAIPYAVWANRGLTPMTVWVARDAEHARLAPKPTATSQAKVTASFCRADMELGRLNDQLLPQNATDGFAPNFDFWPHKGTAEWVAYEFPQPLQVRGVTVSWFDDAGSGECRLPLSWRVLYRAADGQWQPVSGAAEYSIKRRDPVSVTFAPVTTAALRLEVQLPKDFSSGLYEWEVDAAPAAASTNAAGLDSATLDRWAAPYRGWHYWPDHVIPARPVIGTVTNLLGTDVPTVYQVPGSDKFFMSFVGFDGSGYQSFVAESDDLLHWGNYRLAMGFGPTNEFDHGGCVIGAFLYESYDIKAPRWLKRRDGHFWTLYGAYPRQGGYELRPGYEGVAVSDDGLIWRRGQDRPILAVQDRDCGAWEKDCIYQPWLVEHAGRFYDFYNAANGRFEQTGIAISTNLLSWQRHAGNPVLRNRPGGYDEGFCSDPKVFRDGDHWTMLYFGVGRGGAHIMAAFSHDLLTWTAHPEPLYKAGGNPSGLDRQYAHKISLIYQPKSDTFYLFYNAVPGKKDATGGRGIGLITSKPLPR